MATAVAVHQQSTAKRASSARLPVAADTPKSPYAPGALRMQTDEELGRVRRFCDEHPEFERALGYEGLKQVAATYRDDEDHRTLGELRAAGVPAEWHRIDTDDVNPQWSDEQ